MNLSPRVLRISTTFLFVAAGSEFTACSTSARCISQQSTASACVHSKACMVCTATLKGIKTGIEVILIRIYLEVTNRLCEVDSYYYETKFFMKLFIFLFFSFSFFKKKIKCLNIFVEIIFFLYIIIEKIDFSEKELERINSFSEKELILSMDIFREYLSLKPCLQFFSKCRYIFNQN
jgi:hypothetical protein